LKNQIVGRQDMWILRRIKIKYYDIKNFLRNIWWYRKFLANDWECENESILLVIKLKLRKTLKHYQAGLYTPYVGWEEHLEEIERAYNIIGIVEGFDDGFLEVEEYKTMVKELFCILENYRNWWD
jgi:hypothetical protein